MWICPSCQLPLSLDQNAWKCASNHHFDKAKEGYVNLQLAQERKSKSPGDSKEMIEARRTFLQSGHYDPLVNQLVELIAQSHTQKPPVVFDAGCGEGYYLAKIKAGLAAQGIQCQAMGSDISKAGIQKAAKRYKDCDFSVASTFKIPLPDASVNIVTQVFAPASEHEVARILQPGGVWICVNPATDHLRELKQTIYREHQVHQQESIDSPLFKLEKRSAVRFELSLNSPIEREALLKMTPFYWHTSEQAKSEFIHATFSVTVDFDIQVMRRVDEQ
ncbi:putative RNA methyltransferase [Aliiglaciecola litoralis]|uniref:23S rRNA (Guanine(745)-N(1))-methyltransferase n=1 Tax=Aliiglaciecola litoralis TaxID=582857 RepID=A0ABN1LKP8_9ALTE